MLCDKIRSSLFQSEVLAIEWLSWRIMTYYMNEVYIKTLHKKFYKNL